MTETVTEALEAVCKRARESAIREQVDNPGKWSCDIDKAIVTDILAHLSRASQSVDTECPSCGGLNIACPNGCGRDPETGELRSVP